jgi:RHS repeat-associated protein
VVVDSDGALINREEFTPYGETSFGSFARKRYRFTGKERDEESGLNYHRARYYVQSLGRWTSCDPVTIETPRAQNSTTSYSYVNDRPLIGVDPDGRWIWVPFVVGWILLNNEGTANAPGPNSPTYKSKSDTDFLLGAVIDASTATILTSRANFLIEHGASKIGAITEAGAWGGVYNQAANDLKDSHVSSPSQYLKSAGLGAATGFLFGSLDTGLSKLFGSKGGPAARIKVDQPAKVEATMLEQKVRDASKVMRSSGPPRSEQEATARGWARLQQRVVERALDALEEGSLPVIADALREEGLHLSPTLSELRNVRGVPVVGDRDVVLREIRKALENSTTVRANTSLIGEDVQNELNMLDEARRDVANLRRNPPPQPPIYYPLH